jgi:putative component of membrane protein insertase Oxa1/YidC/SpoIIIJ protein YidD
VKPLYTFGILITSLFCFYITDNLQAQTTNEIQSLKLELQKKVETNFMYYSYMGNSELDLITGRMFMFYKKYISSQDHGSCSFIPSCSEYAIIAIRKQGLFIGSINALDRISRCNGKNNRHYFTDAGTGLLIDEVRNHKYEKD